MPRIYYRANNYIAPYDHLNTNQESHILCKKLDLYRAIITVGTPTFLSWNGIRENGLFRTISNSIIQKVLLVQANIDSNQNGMFLHPSFNGYVSDQKRIVSYNLGMAFAKIYAEKLLGIPNLIHIETLKKMNAVTFIPQIGKPQEPDLVGKTSDGRWHIFEAKGMSKNQLRTKVEDAKEQARQINTIQGQVPETLTACATYFSANRITTLIEDPKGEKEKQIEVDNPKFIEGYCNQFYALKETTQIDLKNETLENIRFKTFDIMTKDLEITVGIEEELNELLEQKNFNLIDEYYSRKRRGENFTVEESQTNLSIGIDGILVKYKNF